MTAVLQPPLARPSPAGGVAGRPDPKKFKYRYRLTTGPHVDSVPVFDADGRRTLWHAKEDDHGEDCPGCVVANDKRVGQPVERERYFHALGKAAPEHCQPNCGNLIETNQYLDRLNVQGYRPKFERVHDDKPAGAITAEELDSRGLTEDVLRQLLETYAPKAAAPPPQGQPTSPGGGTTPPVPPARQPPPTNPEGLSYKQLQEFAAAEEIPGYEEAKSKADLVALVRRHGITPHG